MNEASRALEYTRRTSRFEEYLEDFVRALGQMGLCSRQKLAQDTLTIAGRPASSNLKQQSPRVGFVSSRVLFSSPAPFIPRPELPGFVTDICDEMTRTVDKKSILANLFNELSRICEQKPYQLHYIAELRSSSDSTPLTRHQLKDGATSLESFFEEYLLKCRQTAEEIRNSIDKTLSGHSTVGEAYQEANLYPRISPIFLLKRLNHTFWNKLSPD